MAGKLARVEDLDADASEKMVRMLLKGKDSAVHLQTLLQNGGDLRNLRAGSSKPSPTELTRRILRSFTRALSELTESTQIFDEKKKKGRRGSYKRRRNSDSWVIESSNIEDGHAWRKYGQKTILNSQYPRCYYRCSHKPEGCKAMKQVQVIREEPVLYQITYFHYHTCSAIMVATTTSHLGILYSSLTDPVESSNLINFQTKKCDLLGNAAAMMKCGTVNDEALSDGISSSTLLDDALWVKMAGVDDEQGIGSQPCNDLDEFGNIFLFGSDDQME